MAVWNGSKKIHVKITVVAEWLSVMSEVFLYFVVIGLKHAKQWHGPLIKGEKRIAICRRK